MLPQIVSGHYKLCQYTSLWLLPALPACSVVGTLQVDIAAPANEQGEGKII